MTTKKVLVLTEEEVTTIMACGKLLREIANGLSDNTIDELAPDTVSLIRAVAQMASETVGC